jgi:hypothetical protein
MQGFSAKVVSQTAVSRLSGHYDMLPSSGHAALVHSGFTALAKKNASPCRSSADMPIGFQSQDLPSAPIRPLEGPCATSCNSTKEPVVRIIPDPSVLTLSNSTTEPVVSAMLVATALPMVIPSNSTTEPVAKATPIVTVPEPVTRGDVTPLPEMPATLPPTDTRDLPAGFEELPLYAYTRQGMTHGPSVKETQARFLLARSQAGTHCRASDSHRGSCAVGHTRGDAQNEDKFWKPL